MVRRGKKVTMKTVARRARVSVSTVSMALADHPRISSETKQLVTKVCRELEYSNPRREKESRAAAAALRFGYTSLGVNAGDEAISSLLHALAIHAPTYGVSVEIAAIADLRNPDAVYEQALSFATKLDGVLLWGQVTSDLVRHVSLGKVPVVVVGRVTLPKPYESAPQLINSVVTDEVAMARLATNWLIDRGHKRVGLICETLPIGQYNARWLDGYRLAHCDAALPVDADLVNVSGKEFAGGELAAEAFSSLANPPTAFVVPDARLAFSFKDAMARLGHTIDAESMVIGTEWSIARKYHLETFPLIGEDREGISQAALKLLTRLRLDAKQKPVQIVVPFVMHNFGGSSVLDHVQPTRRQA